MKDKQIHFNCPVEASLSLIGGKYKPLILWHLIDQPLHYMELQSLKSHSRLVLGVEKKVMCSNNAQNDTIQTVKATSIASLDQKVKITHL